MLGVWKDWSVNYKKQSGLTYEINGCFPKYLGVVLYENPNNTLVFDDSDFVDLLPMCDKKPIYFKLPFDICIPEKQFSNNYVSLADKIVELLD